MVTDKQANQYDVIVLGLGVMGTAAAYHLAKDGQRVLGLEQFALDHRLGSSYGESRIIRYAYDHPIYVEMAKAVFPMWRDLEAESGQALMFQIGGLDFGLVDSESLLTTRDTMLATHVPLEWITPAEVAKRLPQFQLDDNMMAIYQPDGGYLAASQCVLAQANLARKHGATLLTNTPVLKVEALTDSVHIQTATESYEAARLVITAGSWAAHVLTMLDLRLPLQPTREELVFFEPSDPTAFLPDRCPIFICHDQPWRYGLPNVDGSGLKVAIHGRHEPVDPDQVNRTPDEPYIGVIRDFVQHYLPTGNGPVKESRVCLYTMTPDEQFIIDRHPAYQHIAIGAGFSGHGFKFGILIGRMLADLATRGATPYDLSLFSVRRFG
ncbi:MAG: N-methyl-L-tryptophan oxidase [Chloroflexota bacterium]